MRGKKHSKIYEEEMKCSSGRVNCHGDPLICRVDVNYMTYNRSVSGRESAIFRVLRDKDRERHQSILTQWMATAQLRFLIVFSSQFVSYAVQQLHIALLRVLLQRSEERPGHSAGGRSVLTCIGTRLVVLASTPHDDICRRRLGSLCLFPGSRSFCYFLEKVETLAKSIRDGFAAISTSIGHDGRKKAGAGFLGEIRLLEHTLRVVDIGKIQRGAGMAGIEDGS